MIARAGLQTTDEESQACLALFQPCNEQLIIRTAKSHGRLPLETREKASEDRCSLGFIVRVLAKDDKALQYGRDRQVLLCGQLCPFSMSQQHWRGVSLETCDGLRLTCLAHNIHSL